MTATHERSIAIIQSMHSTYSINTVARLLTADSKFNTIDGLVDLDAKEDLRTELCCVVV